MYERSQIQDIVFRAIDRVNEVRLVENALPKASGTALLGPDAQLDSMGFVNFVVALEEEIAAGTGLALNVIEDLNSNTDNASKPRTVDELIDFVFTRIQQTVAGA